MIERHNGPDERSESSQSITHLPTLATCPHTNAEEENARYSRKGTDRSVHQVALPTSPERIDPKDKIPNQNDATRAARAECDTESASAKGMPVKWRSLPRKDQLLILALARLSEPLTQTSLSTYMFYQLRSFNPSLSDSTIASQAGLLQGAFTGAQFLTAILWGRVADAEWGGRKIVLLIGLLGTAISVLGFGFSKSFVSAVIFRVLGGALNGNIGVMRTMIAEIIMEKKYQSRAFLILPMTFNIGVLVGPLLGGLLADPASNYPSLFGAKSLLGGSDGVWWMKNWPYALPNIVSAVFLFCSALGVLFGLEETHESLLGRHDYGLAIGRWIHRNIFRYQKHNDYEPLALDESDNRRLSQSFGLHTTHTPTDTNATFREKERKARKRQKLPLRRIWTSNVILTLISHGILAMHIGTFNNLWFIFLSAPRFDAAHPQPKSLKAQSPPIHFTGGLALLPKDIGVALAILGTIGISMQLGLYPRLSSKLGTIKSYRASLLLFPITYFLTPFLAVLPSTRPPPHSVTGAIVWLGIVGVLLIQVLARTFALPCNTILINNCCPHPSVLGTIHGIGQTVSSAARTFGPILGGWAFGMGLKIGVVGTAWWGLAGIAVLGNVAGAFVKEGSGHEILLEGEEGDDG